MEVKKICAKIVGLFMGKGRNCGKKKGPKTQMGVKKMGVKKK